VSTHESRQQSPAPVIDRHSILEQFGGDRELLGEVVATFLREWPGQMTAIERCVAAGDLRGVSVSAHRLKGAVSIFGAEAAVTAARRLERCREDANGESPTELYQRLEQEMRTVETALQFLLRDDLA
jgi:protein-histidine pros-kinase